MTRLFVNFRESLSRREDPYDTFRLREASIVIIYLGSTR